MAEALQQLGIGLSRLLRYSYGGFVVFGLLTVVDDGLTRPVREAMGWELLVITLPILETGGNHEPGG